MTKPDQLIFSAIKDSLVLLTEGETIEAGIRIKKLGQEVTAEFLEHLSFDRTNKNRPSNNRPRNAKGQFIKNS